MRKSCGSNHPPKADGSGAGHPLISHFRRVVVRLARSRAGREGHAPRREGVTAITGRGQRIGRRRTRAAGAGRIESGALSRSEIHRLSLRRGLGILRRLGHVDGLDLGHGDCTLRPAEVDGGRARSRAGGSCGAWQVDGLRGSHWVRPPPVG